jgi:hypothetical protein
MQQPSVGQSVHYVSFGTPGGEYGRACRAAIVTVVHDDDPVPEHGIPYVGLFVANPTGLFLNEHVGYGPGRPAGEDTSLCYGADYDGGTWHWPERV